MSLIATGTWTLTDSKCRKSRALTAHIGIGCQQYIFSLNAQQFACCQDQSQMNTYLYRGEEKEGGSGGHDHSDAAGPSYRCKEDLPSHEQALAQQSNFLISLLLTLHAISIAKPTQVKSSQYQLWDRLQQTTPHSLLHTSSKSVAHTSALMTLSNRNASQHEYTKGNCRFVMCTGHVAHCIPSLHVVVC